MDDQAKDPGVPIAIGLVLYCVAFLFWIALGGPAGNAKALVTDLALLPVGLLATILALRASRAPQIAREAAQAWRSLGLACFSYFLGDLLWLVYEVVLKAPPSPSLASLFYLAYYPLFLFGLLRFPTVLKDRSRRLEFWLDATTVLLGGSMVVWHFVLGPAAAGSGSALASALYLAFPVGDLVLLLGATITILSRRDDPAIPSFRWLVAGLVFEFVADLIQGRNTLQGVVAAGGVPDGLFVVHWLCYGMSALVYRRVASAGPDAAGVDASRSINGVPYAAAVVGYSVLLVAMAGRWTSSLGGLVGCATALTFVVLVRQAMAERVNLRLSGEQAARRSETRFRALVQNASDLIVVVDPDRGIRYLTPSVERVLGHQSKDLEGHPLTTLLHPSETQRCLDLLAAAGAQKGLIGPVAWRAQKADGSQRHLEVTALNLLGEPGIEGVVVTMRDVHERKSLEDRLTHLAFHDRLTGLPNRALLSDRLAHSLAWARREGRALSLLCIDLDHFKAVNDGIGHGAGDQVLQEVARRLTSTLRTTDTAARLGGDEFAVLLEDTGDAPGAILVADRLLEALRQPIPLEGGEATVSASIGIAVSHGGSEGPSEVLRNADVAMHEAKRAGRNRALAFEPAQHTVLVERLTTETDLRHALERSEMELLYQPIVSLRTGAVLGAEALLRWRHPRRGLLPPSEFVSLAEDTDLIVSIGRWALEEACRRAASWGRGGEGSPAYLSVNLSGRQLQEPGFVREVHAALALTGLPASQLMLEITETFPLLEAPPILGRLHDLEDLGLRLAIDDFGTGYSSLSYLQTLPMAVVKIDKSFVVASGTRATPVLRGIVELGRSMGLDLVAEGIETADQVATLRGLGCECGQGFLFARPMEAEAVGRLLAQGVAVPVPSG